VLFYELTILRCNHMYRLRNGFTLIEMIVVLVIMSVLAAVVAPRLGDFYQSVKLNSTARQLKLFLDAARTEAAANSCACRVIIRPGWREINIETQKWNKVNNPKEAVAYIAQLENLDTFSGDAAGKKMVFIPVEGAFKKMLLPEGVSFNYISVSGKRLAWINEVVVTFNSLHQAEEVVFLLENTQKQYSGLRLEAGSGIVHDLQVIVH